MKFNIYKSVAMCSLLALAGCHDFEELNTDPYAPIYDPTVENVSPDGIDIDYELSDGRGYWSNIGQLPLRRCI